MEEVKPTPVISDKLQEKINKWKTEHGEVYKLSAGGSTCYLKKPSVESMDLAIVASNGGKMPMRFAKKIITENWLEGDTSIYTDLPKLQGASRQLKSMMQAVESEIEKL